MSDSKKFELVAVFMAGGRGTRLRPLTDNIPKPLAMVQDKTLLQRNLDRVIDNVDRVIIVVSYLAELIQREIGDEYKGKPIVYALQDNPKGGTLDAFRTAIYKDTQKKVDLEVNYLVSNSDDLHGPELYQDFFKTIKVFPNQSLVGAKIFEDQARLSSFGVIETNDRGDYQKIWEKPEKYVSNLVNIGLYYFPNKIIHLVSKDRDVQNNGEEYLTDLLNWIHKEDSIRVISTTGFWMPITNLEDLSAAQNLRLK
jgi:UDP-N-acetylglucosamine diphosphorylase / glucose-1-phosphate thymidylyltransferase / UDP-N-acetylgalactosamine diphosphorylase / glucosamine-1-phosphate N-acetyltransferase / galactosamine-1-phosphate N-acetyltransferase